MLAKKKMLRWYYSFKTNGRLQNQMYTTECELRLHLKTIHLYGQITVNLSHAKVTGEFWNKIYFQPLQISV